MLRSIASGVWRDIVHRDYSSLVHMAQVRLADEELLTLAGFSQPFSIHLDWRATICYTRRNRKPTLAGEHAGGLLYVFDRRKTKTREKRSVFLISIGLTSG